MIILGFKIDFWTIWGFLAQGFFFARFIIQWIKSEKEGKIVVPHVFWILSLCGSAMTLIYALARKDLVFLIAAILQFFLFSRNLLLSKNSKIKIKKDFIAGNYTDKYHSKNPVNQYLMKNFLSDFEEILNKLKTKEIKNVCEIGCGEGELLKIIHLHLPKAKIYASDLSKSEINKSKINTKGIPIIFSVQNAEKLNYKDQQFDLVVCCEVIEHLKKPTQGIKEIKRISKNSIISVPIEPWWRILNMMRLKYLNELGNTPGHLNHWSVKKFSLLLSQNLKIITKKIPFPWQMYFLSNLNTDQET